MATIEILKRMDVQLFLHFGLYKTGTSFIQAICANNRGHLINNGYYFPKSVREKDMISGKISPGNGNGLTLKIKESDTNFCTKLLKKWKEQAIKINCNKILISDEALIHGFASEGGLECLIQAAKNNQIFEIYSFAFLRDPIDHCLSTFKHRAKRGNLQDFENWVFTQYETPLVLEKFYAKISHYPIKWMFAKYSNNGNKMAIIFFKKWLNMDMPIIPNGGAINASLTLSEIAFLKSASSFENWIVPYLFEQLIKVPLEKKDIDRNLNLAYRQIAYQFLQKFRATFIQFNELLHDNEKLLLEEEIEPLYSNPNFYTFSINQLNAINNGYVIGNRFPARVEILLNKLKRFFKRTKSKLFR